MNINDKVALHLGQLSVSVIDLSSRLEEASAEVGRCYSLIDDLRTGKVTPEAVAERLPKFAAWAMAKATPA
jgi:hypothetical protein